jgi:protein-tyrosine phosphatase
MDWITDEIAIGNFAESQDVALLKASRIRSILSLDGSLDRQHAAELGVAEVVGYPLIDGPGNDLRVMEFAVADLESLVRRLSPVLVHCHAGRSRSVAVVAGYLMRRHDISADEAIRRVSARRESSVAPALLDLLDRLES